MTKTDLRDLFHRHQSAEEIDRALRVLAEKGLARYETRETAGRPVTTWSAV
jgi:hypothetical protein